MEQILCDMHMHSQSSHDSVAPVCETAKACIEKGIFAFAITDHCDIQYYESQNVPGIVNSSVLETTAAKSEFLGKVKILSGVEIGEGIWDKEHTDKILSSHRFDVVISSVHAVRYLGYTDPYSTIDFSKMTSEELDGYLSAYFDDLYEMVSTLDFDVMAHLTCPLRYINGKYGLGVDAMRYKAQIEKILDLVVKKGVAMEINTSGIGTAYGTYMPDPWIIRLYKEKGGYLVTLGSDAHTPENAGKGFDCAIELLQSYGFDGYYYYQGRKPIKIEFNI